VSLIIYHQKAVAFALALRMALSFRVILFLLPSAIKSLSGMGIEKDVIKESYTLDT